MQDDMQSLHENHTNDLVNLLQGKKVLKKNGIQIENWKHWLEIQVQCMPSCEGFSEKKGVDFLRNFYLVLKMSSIWLAFGLTTCMILEVKQHDVKTTFVHGDLEEEIDMQQPRGFEVKGKENLVCKLKKSLYAIKQSPKQW